MFKSLFGIVEDVVKIAVAPVEVVLDVAQAVTKPVAELSEEAVKEIKNTIKEVSN